MRTFSLDRPRGVVEAEGTPVPILWDPITLSLRGLWRHPRYRVGSSEHPPPEGNPAVLGN